MRTFVGIAVLAAILTAPAVAQGTATNPLTIARILAAKYPVQPILSYIPALAWSNSMKLSALTAEPQWKEKAAAIEVEMLNRSRR